MSNYVSFQTDRKLEFTMKILGESRPMSTHGIDTCAQNWLILMGPNRGQN